MGGPVSTLSRATRRLIVAHLTQCGMNAADIAAELGVSRETVRRDLHNPPHGDVLVLRLDEPLRQALAVLRATVRQPDTPTQNIAAARAAIRATADTVREAHPEVTPS
jgi:predicted ArsR family transcriptional regulator